MNKILVLFNKFYESKLFRSLILAGILLSTSQIAVADYKPPPKEETNNSTAGLVARGGCSANQKTFLTALAPQHHIGKTVANRPTWAWFVPDSKPYQLRFQLYEYEANSKLKLVWQKNLKSQPGIMTLTLPAEQSKLTVGQKYRWKVIIFCNPNRPSNSLVAEADLEVVPLSENLKNQLNTNVEPIAIADLFAEAGIWYDAFSRAILVAQSTTNSRFELELLEDLAQIEDTVYAPNHPDYTAKHSYKLRQVIEAEREKSSFSSFKI